MKQTISLILLLAVLILGFGSIFIISETEQAVVTQFGRPVGGAITDAGIHFKTPIIQTVMKFENRILEWDGSPKEIPTLDNKYIKIDTGICDGTANRFTKLCNNCLFSLINGIY